jgi:hypothetical protein
MTNTGNFISNDSVCNFTVTAYSNTWFHIAYVYTAASGKVEFFLNGVSQGSITSQPTSLFNGTDPTAIGTDSSLNDGSTFDGQISLARVWTTTRTGAQLLANYCNVLGSTTNLGAEYTLNNVLTDNSGNGNTLTNLNTATFTTDTPSTCAAVATTGNFLAFM